MTERDPQYPDRKRESKPTRQPAGKPPLSRSLGGFFGELWKAVTHDPSAGNASSPRRDERATDASPTAPPEPRVQMVDQRVEEKTVDTPLGPVTLRRTTIDEVEFHQEPPGKT